MKPRSVEDVRAMAQAFAKDPSEPDDTWASERKLARELLAALAVVEAAERQTDSQYVGRTRAAAVLATEHAVGKWRTR